MDKGAAEVAPGAHGTSGEIRQIVSAHYAEQLENLRGRVEAKDGDALLSAVVVALISRDPFPEWLGNHLAGAIYRYRHHDALTLDEAFGVSRPSGYRRRARRDLRRKGTVLAFDVRRMIQAGAVVDEALFAAVGELHGVGKTTAAKWYYYYADSYLLSHVRPMTREALPANLAAIADRVEWRD